MKSVLQKANIRQQCTFKQLSLAVLQAIADRQLQGITNNPAQIISTLGNKSSFIKSHLVNMIRAVSNPKAPGPSLPLTRPFQGRFRDSNTCPLPIIHDIRRVLETATRTLHCCCYGCQANLVCRTGQLQNTQWQHRLPVQVLSVHCNQVYLTFAKRLKQFIQLHEQKTCSTGQITNNK